FHLDNDNSQHFYEDIGKYEQYIFGWADWYDIYAIDEDSNFGPDWLFETGDNSEPDWRWVGNAVTNPESEYYLGNESLYNQNQGIYSGFRAEYIAMRQDAEDYFNTANMLGFGIVFNHILASLDALRVTRKYNLEYISQNNLRIKFTPVFINNELSAGVMISKDF
ncbi:MAG: hypothetical protein JXB60_01870, partial [Candidatus Cloacimonetes bacterium]|nr:hypothetical protein [Candidatus Cloacimonadota bacterium]